MSFDLLTIEGGVSPPSPFVTTREKGTGLGLAVCYSIAARHQAKIDYETSSQGTTFNIRFPIPTEQLTMV